MAISEELLYIVSASTFVEKRHRQICDRLALCSDANPAIWGIHPIPKILKARNGTRPGDNEEFARQGPYLFFGLVVFCSPGPTTFRFLGWGSCTNVHSCL
jgi:hypothetical protein